MAVRLEPLGNSYKSIELQECLAPGDMNVLPGDNCVDKDMGTRGAWRIVAFARRFGTDFHLAALEQH
ncbi:hypothetical protein DEO72_LG1g2881 [Vigna unguiculata]|uniref:Uncharacterized protein n=1 Tax=Vigna unguiculata TaxID=3917 RepID=A0A4D6KNW8_VIGUN|nr:hypothetical protein DEO72_LG1g2881 [Vigna unguiculata]